MVKHAGATLKYAFVNGTVPRLDQINRHNGVIWYYLVVKRDRMFKRLFLLTLISQKYSTSNFGYVIYSCVIINCLLICVKLILPGDYFYSCFDTVFKNTVAYLKTIFHDVNNNNNNNNTKKKKMKKNSSNNKCSIRTKQQQQHQRQQEQ